MNTMLLKCKQEVNAAFDRHTPYYSLLDPAVKATESIVATCCHNHENIKADVDLKRLCFFILRWGCREHFVSGCCHSSGRDRGRYPREGWLSTLGVLHPGVPALWYGHIRLKAVRGAVCPM